MTNIRSEQGRRKKEGRRGQGRKGWFTLRAASMNLSIETSNQFYHRKSGQDKVQDNGIKYLSV